MVLSLGYPAMLLWGVEDLVVAYNAPHWPILAEKPSPIGKSVRAVWPELEARMSHWLASVRAGETLVFQREPLKVDNGRFIEDVIYDFSLSPVRDCDGNVEGVLLISADITDREKQKAILTENEALQKLLIHSVASFTWEADAKGENLTIPYIAPDTRLSEYAISNWLLSVHPDDREHAEQSWQDAITQGTAYDCEYRVGSELDGWVWNNARGAPIRNNSGKVIKWVGMNLNIHEHKRNEYALADALDHKDRFIATISHEIRNPVAAISAGLFALEKLPPDDIERNANLMRRQITQLTRLVNDLLDTVRVNRRSLMIRKTDIEIEDVLLSTIEDARHIIEGCDIGFEFEPPAVEDHRCMIQGDASRLSQVFVNLLSNAFRHASRRVEFIARYNSDGVLVVVNDDGKGINPQELGFLFDDSEHSKIQGANDGLGLGLRISKYIVEAHGGSITAMSEGIDQGASFAVFLPSSGKPRPQTSKAPASLSAVDRPRNVLLVEDQKDVAEAMGTMIEHMGHHLKMAHSGKDALGVLEEYRPDIILLDIGLPDMTGIELAKKIVDTGAQQQAMLVALSGWFTPAYERLASEAGIGRFLAKPIDIKELETLLSQQNLRPSA